MALPSSGYDLLSLPKPDSDLTDFTAVIDSENLSASWHAAVDTSDGTKARFALGDAEVAFDAIPYDTGKWLFRVMIDGTYSSTVDQVLRAYPPMAANDSYAADATYGQHAAYNVNWRCYWPAGGGEDRTVNGNDGTAQGGVTAGGVAGPLGAATDYDGSDDYFTIANTMLADTWSALGQFVTDTVSSNQWPIYGEFRAAALDTKNYIVVNTSSLLCDQYPPSGNSGGIAGVSASQWYCFAVVQTSANSRNIFLDGGSKSTATETYSGDAPDAWAIGARLGSSPKRWNGRLCGIHLLASAVPDEWVVHEYAATSDNAAFWGTPTWVPGGAARDIPFTRPFRPAFAGAFG